MRRCNKITGGSCFGNPMTANYSLAQTIDVNGDIDFTCDNTDNCLEDSCIIDMTFGLEILAYMEANPSFTPTVTLVGECLANRIRMVKFKRGFAVELHRIWSLR